MTERSLAAPDALRGTFLVWAAMTVVDVVTFVPVLHLCTTVFIVLVLRSCYRRRMFSANETLVFVLLSLFLLLVLIVACESWLITFIADISLLGHSLYQADFPSDPTSLLIFGAAIGVLNYFSTQYLRYFPSIIWRMLLAASASIGSVLLLIFVIGGGESLPPSSRKRLKNIAKLVNKIDAEFDTASKLSETSIDSSCIDSLAPAELDQGADRSAIEKPISATTMARLVKGSVLFKHTKGSRRPRHVRLNPASGCIEWWRLDSPAPSLMGQTPTNTIQSIRQQPPTIFAVSFLTRTLVLEARMPEEAQNWVDDLTELLLHHQQ